jgi:hypothetical protein
MKLNKPKLWTAVILASLVLPLPVLAQANGFYNNQLPGAQGVVEDESMPGDKKNKLSPAGGDYTPDEKRVQDKYKAKVRSAKDLVAKGEHMMKASENPNSKEYKKGKIFKEIGEKDLADLEQNNPFPKSDKPAKAGKTGAMSDAEKKEL